MPRLSPFEGLLYDRSRVGSLTAVTAPPYDTVDVEQQSRLRASSPYNIVHIDLPERRADDAKNDNQYTRAAAKLREWRRAGVLGRMPAAALYPYEMRFRYEGARRRIRGVICEVDVEPWGGAILPHEETMPGPVEDRLRLVRELRLNLSPVYALASGSGGAVTAFLEAEMRSEPAASVVDEAGVEHRLWICTDVPSDPLRVGSLLIADGHHRYAMALRYRAEMRKTRGPGPWDALMMLVVDQADEQPPVLPIHRLSDVETSLRGERVRDLEEVLAALDDSTLTFGIVRLDDGGIVHDVARASGPPPTVSALTEQVPSLHDPARVRFTPDSVAAEEAVRSRSAATAYLLPPTSADAIRSVIEEGRRMPQKSTYFWPKPRTGLVLRPMDDSPMAHTAGAVAHR
jgi:uncharacterized protein (DUF1015 family)